MRVINVWILVLAMVAVGAFALDAGAEAKKKKETPLALSGGTIITAEEAKALVDGKNAAFFDTRSALNCGKGHIPTATCLPYKGTSENKVDFDPSQDDFNAEKLPAEKDVNIVFYSHGTTGWKSFKSAVQSIDAGHTNVMWLRSGFASWLDAGYPSEN